MPVPLCFLLSYSQFKRKVSIGEVKIVFCFNLHFFFIISKAEHLSWFAGHLYILSKSLACC